MLNFNLASTDEICQELGSRIKAARVQQGLHQEDVAARTGISRGTLVTLENKGQGAIATLIQVLKVLGLDHELQDLFKVQVLSIAEMERLANSHRVRAPRRKVKSAAPPGAEAVATSAPPSEPSSPTDTVESDDDPVLSVQMTGEPLT